MESPFGFLDVLLLVVAWSGASLLILPLSGPVDAKDPTVEQLTRLTWTQGGLQLMATLVVWGLLSIRYRRTPVRGSKTDAEAPVSWRTQVGWGLITFLLLVPPVLVVQALVSQWIPYEHSTLELLQTGGTMTILACWFSSVGVAPLIEEFFFRHLLQGWLQRLNSRTVQRNEVLTGGWLSNSESGKGLDFEPRPWWPVIVSASIFAAGHIGQGGAPIPLLLLGLGLGALYRHTGSLIACTVVHVLLNAYSMFWFTMAVIYGEPT